MTDGYDRPLGKIEGKAFSLVVRATPSYDNPEDFSTSLRLIKSLTEDEEVVRIDNSHGKGAHIHRLYRRDEAEEPFDGGIWEAVDKLQRNWRTYAKSYLAENDL